MTKNVMAKKSLKHVEIALNNFNEIAKPYHEQLLEEHKNTLTQVQNDKSKLRRFQIAIRRTEAQLKSLLYELDTLRAQVNDNELDTFDMKTVALRKTILLIINQYKDITKQIQSIPVHENKKETINDRGQDEKQLQLLVNMDEIKLKERESTLKNVEEIHDNIQELHTIYGDLNQIVHEQGELVEKVEKDVVEIKENTYAGTRYVLTAARLKASVYPVSGAVMGGVVGGPIGLVAGLKIGSIAAVCCGCLGYLGGRIINKYSTPNESELNQENQMYNDNQVVLTQDDTREKKDE